MRDFVRRTIFRISLSNKHPINGHKSPMKEVYAIISMFLILGIGLGIALPIPDKYMPLSIFLIPIAILIYWYGMVRK